MNKPKEAIAADLARVLLAKGEPHRVIELIGEVSQWPQQRRLALALSKGEAELRLPNFDRRVLTKSFVDVFRLRSTASADGAVVDLAWFDRHTSQLRQQQADVEGGYQHFVCNRGPESAVDSRLPAVQSRNTDRRVLQVGPDQQLRRPSDAARVAQDNDIIEICQGTERPRSDPV